MSLVRSRRKLSGQAFCQLLVESVFKAGSIVLFSRSLTNLRLRADSNGSGGIFDEAIVVNTNLQTCLRRRGRGVVTVRSRFKTVSVHATYAAASITSSLIQLLPSSELQRTEDAIPSKLRSDPTLSQGLDHQVDRQKSIDSSPLSNNIRSSLAPVKFSCGFSSVTKAFISLPRHTNSLQEQFDRVGHVGPFRLTGDFALIGRGRLCTMLRGLRSTLNPEVYRFSLIVVSKSATGRVRGRGA